MKSVTRPLLHFGAEPLVEVRDIRQLPQRREFMKPDGLWFSVGDGDDGWRAWCEGQNFNLERFAHCTEIITDPDARILTLSGAGEIDRFTAEYSVPLHAELSMCCIDWNAVADSYDGLIISPYCWERRLERNTIWYYGWDCASGCIWRASAIKELRPFVIGAPA